MVLRVGDVQVARPVEGKARRVIELRRGRGPAVATGTLRPRAHDRGDRSGGRSDLPHSILAGVGDVEIARCVRCESADAVELRLRCGPTVAAVTSGSGPRDEAKRP